MSKLEREESSDDVMMQRALLEVIRQNSRLLDELQAARRREDDLIDRVMQLEEKLRRHYSIGTNTSSKYLSTSTTEVQEDIQTIKSEPETQADDEPLVEWNRVPHYEIIVNGKTKCEGFVANNSCVCFIQPDVVKRAKLHPYKVNPPARFKFFGSNEQVIVAEAVMVPIQIGNYSAKYPMFVYNVRSEIILGANWLHNERVHWEVDFMLVGPRKIRLNPKPPIMIKESDPRASMLDGPVIIERLT
ncbi:hypothetical protein BJV82DRAFT_592650 [Fennellomyces sp. T-0311]|nr:hypothetical protein BJV82DRAFT_592650 [Fennellomyces sp. T-0311]